MPSVQLLLQLPTCRVFWQAAGDGDIHRLMLQSQLAAILKLE